MQHNLSPRPQTESRNEQGFLATAKRIMRVVGHILRRAEEHHIYLAASGIAFNILIFILPTMLVMVFVIGAFMDRALVVGAIEDFLLDVLPPDGGLDATIDLVKNEINHVLQNSGSAAWIGIPALFWVSLALFSSIRTALNAVFGFRHKITFLGSAGRDSLLLTLFVIAVLMSNTAPHLAASAADWATATIAGGSFVRTLASGLVSTTIIYFFFVALYSFTPNRLPPFSVILASALFSVIFWQSARFGFGLYVKYFATYGKVYGIYGAAVAVAFWVYYSALLILFSGELGQYWYEARRRRKLTAKHSTVFAKSSDDILER